MNKSKILIFSIIFLFTTAIFSQNSNVHIYLCFGQSNMEGQGEIGALDKIVNDRFQMMSTTDCPNLERKIGGVYKAVPPLSQCYTGLSPADYFGRTMVEKLPDSIKVIVINVAVGGCDIRLFDKNLYKNHVRTYDEPWFIDKIEAYGGNPYHRLIEVAKLAQKRGVIKGVLLHQGETNTGNSDWPLYVKDIYSNMINDLQLNASDVPLLAGELVHEDQNGKCASMNSIIATLPSVVPNSYVISSKGCSVKSDDIHFNAEGYRELGRRYASKMLTLLDSNTE